MRIFLFTGLLLSCATTENAPTGTSAREAAPATESANASDPDADSDRKVGVLRVEKANPGSTKIMRDSCRGRYKVLPDRDAKRPQMEVGVARAVGGGAVGSSEATPYPYIRYRCED